MGISWCLRCIMNPSFFFLLSPLGSWACFPYCCSRIQRGEAAIINRKVQLSNPWYSLWNTSAFCLWRLFPRPSGGLDIKVHTPSISCYQLLFGNAPCVCMLLELHRTSRLSLAFYKRSCCYHNYHSFIIFFNHYSVYPELLFTIDSPKRSSACSIIADWSIIYFPTPTQMTGHLNKTRSCSLTGRSYQQLSSPRPCPPDDLFFNSL